MRRLACWFGWHRATVASRVYGLLDVLWYECVDCGQTLEVLGCTRKHATNRKVRV
jgi:hypothetical protein